VIRVQRGCATDDGGASLDELSPAGTHGRDLSAVWV
jgi:hypothetical protein